MKRFMAVSGLALATLIVPQAALGQNAAPETTIVVTAENQRDWDRGNELEAKGLRDFQEANRDLVRRSAEVVNLQERRDTSRSRAENARQAFQSLTARPFFSDAEDARRWAKQVESTAKDWERFAERGDEAERDLTRAQRRQERAQEEVDEAQNRIDEGRALMAAAERASSIRASR